MTVYSLETCETVMKDSLQLALQGKLQPWDSLIASVQTAGRGQYGRQWFSPKGNIYAALRLPLESPFDGLQAPLVVSTILCEALRSLNFDTSIKWMNDLVCREQKIGGILLEKKGSILIAGIGINVLFYPEPNSLRKGFAIEATSLVEQYPDIRDKYSPRELWEIIVNKFTQIQGEDLRNTWKNKAENYLLWWKKPISLSVDNHSFSGVFSGINEEGGLILQMKEGVKTFYSGSVTPL